MDPSGKAIPSKLDYFPSPGSGTSVLTLTPVSYLQSPPVYLNINSVYTVTVGGGVKTLTGDAMTGLVVWSFATNNSPDFTPPTFGGVISAEGLNMGSIKVTWGPAVDNSGGTPASQLIFHLCYSTNPIVCKIKFDQVSKTNPQATVDSNGNYTFVVNPLIPATTYYFMVRVEDLAGNRDANTVVVSGTTRSGKLYVANLNNNEILAFDRPSKLSQSAGHIRSIKASQNGLIDPYGIFYDNDKAHDKHDRLYVALCQTASTSTLIEAVIPVNCVSGSSKIAVYDNASTLPDQDKVPDRTIINGLNGIDSGLNGPVGIFLDNSSGNDTLYVANFNGKSVTIYDNVTSSCQAFISANGTNGTCSLRPRSNFISNDLLTPFGIVYDPLRQFLYVSNYIKSFQSINQSNGSIIPVDRNGTIAVFDGNTQLGGARSYPAKNVIGGNSEFSSPSGLWLDSSSDTLYVANSGPNLGPSQSNSGIVAICNVRGITLQPIYSLPGPQPLPAVSTPCTANSAPSTQFLIWPFDSNTRNGFLWPVQVAVTTTASSSTSLYVSDYSNNNVSVYSPNPLFSTTTALTNTPSMITPPNHILYGFNAQIWKPAGLGVNPSAGGDRLYLANSGWDQIMFFDQLDYTQCTGAASSQCLFSPSRMISSSITTPGGLFLNNSPDVSGTPMDRLYISNYTANSIVVLDNASTLSGNAYDQNAVYKFITSPALKNPFGIYVDVNPALNREWIYVVNSLKDATGMFAVLVFDLADCPGAAVSCNINPKKEIRSVDFVNPSGIWVDEARDSNNQPRNILFVSNRGNFVGSDPGSIVMFNISSTLSGSVTLTPDKIIKGDQTSLSIPTGFFMDPVKDQLYVSNQGYDDILVFNQPQNCTTMTPQSKQCNVFPDRTIYNITDTLHPIDDPSSLVIDFSADKIYLTTIGRYTPPSILVIDKATTTGAVAGSTDPSSSRISDSFPSSTSGSYLYQLAFPEGIVLDSTR